MDDLITEQVPEEWRALGFSGLFVIEASTDDPDEWERRCPVRCPLDTNGNWLALRVNRDVEPPTVVLVRQDSSAIVDLYTGRMKQGPLGVVK
jgi:hypothetical protein